MIKSYQNWQLRKTAFMGKIITRGTSESARPSPPMEMKTTA